jgi:hypothetical protein
MRLDAKRLFRYVLRVEVKSQAKLGGRIDLILIVAIPNHLCALHM